MALAFRQKDVLGLAAWLALSFTVSAIGAIASVEAKDFYQMLVQPTWAPPPWLFGPVWSVLYALMGVASWLVWRSGGFRAHAVALGLFLVQLALNALWSWLFFGWHLGGWAFAEVVLLWLVIAATLISFWRIQWVAGLLLAPYLGWVAFAATLNYVLWQHNPQLLAVAVAAGGVA